MGTSHGAQKTRYNWWMVMDGVKQWCMCVWVCVIKQSSLTCAVINIRSLTNPLILYNFATPVVVCYRLENKLQCRQLFVCVFFCIYAASCWIKIKYNFKINCKHARGYWLLTCVNEPHMHSSRATLSHTSLYVMSELSVTPGSGFSATFRLIRHRDHPSVISCHYVL